jgi:hypothetical protein
MTDRRNPFHLNGLPAWRKLECPLEGDRWLGKVLNIQLQLDGLMN